MNQKYRVKLTDEERQQLEQLLSSGIAPVRKLKHAQVLLKSDCSEEGCNWSYSKICEASMFQQIWFLMYGNDTLK